MFATGITSYILVALQLLFMAGLPLSGRPVPAAPLSLGLLILSAVLGFSGVYSMRLHGRFNVFPDLVPNTRLVTAGPYRYIRHPMYSALILAAASWLLDDFNPVRLMLMVGLVCVLIAKIGREERKLGQHFPEYALYSRHTYRLFPYLY